MHAQGERRSPLGRIATMTVLAVIGVLVVAGCGGLGSKGTPTRSAPQPPKHCTVSDCPELPVYSSKRLEPSGITAADAGDKVPAYLTNVLDDLDRTWQDWFSALNIEQIQPGRVLIADGKTFTSDCTDEDGKTHELTSDFPNAFFCGVDTQPDGSGSQRAGSIILPVQTFADIWNGKLMGSKGVMLGDFTAATIIAHEYGHNVVFRLAKAYGLSESQLPRGDANELIADCFAGNWAGTVFARKDLSIKEIAQAAALIISVGDPAPNQGHGTSIERATALTRGFAESFTKQGQPIGCLKKYWPEVVK